MVNESSMVNCMILKKDWKRGLEISTKKVTFEPMKHQHIVRNLCLKLVLTYLIKCWINPEYDLHLFTQGVPLELTEIKNNQFNYCKH